MSVPRTDAWGTPWWLVRELESRYGRFDLDAAAEPWSAVCPRFLSLTEDALDPATPWTGARVFLNPPYERLQLVRFLERAWLESSQNAKLVVAVLSSRTETDWFAELVVARAEELLFVTRRIHFRSPPGHGIGPGREKSSRPVFATVCAVFNCHPPARGPRCGTIVAPTPAEARKIEAERHSQATLRVVAAP